MVVKEHFVRFVNILDSSGASLTEVVLEKLKSHDIPISNCRGQGYDNGANMAGKNSGLQKRILDINPLHISATVHVIISIWFYVTAQNQTNHFLPILE